MSGLPTGATVLVLNLLQGLCYCFQRFHYYSGRPAGRVLEEMKLRLTQPSRAWAWAELGNTKNSGLPKLLHWLHALCSDQCVKCIENASTQYVIVQLTGINISIMDVMELL